MSNPSPLTEAVPASLDILFDRDPLELQQQDIETIVKELRAQRARWEKAQAKPKKIAAPADLQLDLSEIKL